MKRVDLTPRFNRFLKFLNKIKNPLLIIHPRPDADALGSSFALAYFLLEKLGLKDISVYSSDKLGRIMVEIFNDFEVTDRLELEKFDSLIILDFADVFFRFELSSKIAPFPNIKTIINIDHHENKFLNLEFSKETDRKKSEIELLNIINSKASATCEIIYHFFTQQKLEISSRVAQLLLNGIYADTGAFRHNNTTAEVLEIAGELMKKGASIKRAGKILMENKSINTLKLWAIALERVKVDPKTGMAASYITKDDLKKLGANRDDLTGIAEILSTIADSKFSLVLTEYHKNKIKASLRSEQYKGVDVAKIAQGFNGGGHTLASGFEIKGKIKSTQDGWEIE